MTTEIERFEQNDGHFCEVCVRTMEKAYIGGVIVGHKCCLHAIDVNTFDYTDNLKEIDRLEYLAENPVTLP